MLDQTAAFYQFQLHRYGEAIEYLHQRGLRDPHLIEKLGIGYTPGGCLRRHLNELGHSITLLWGAGLVNEHGRDTFCRRIVFPWRDRQRTINLYGRSIGAAPRHRFLRRPKGGLFAWETVHTFSSVILVEGLFDLAGALADWLSQHHLRPGNHLTQVQFSQLCDAPNRQVFLVLDQDTNHAGQEAACRLAQRLGNAGVSARLVELPPGHDPNSFFASGTTAADFRRCLEKAPALRP